MTVPVTDLPIAGRPLTGDSGSTTFYCAAQSNDSFLGSRRSCQMRRATQSAKTSRSRSIWEPAASCALRKLGGTVAGTSACLMLGQGRTAVTNTERPLTTFGKTSAFWLQFRCIMPLWAEIGRLCISRSTKSLPNSLVGLAYGSSINVRICSVIASVGHGMWFQHHRVEPW